MAFLDPLLSFESLLFLDAFEVLDLEVLDFDVLGLGFGFRLVDLGFFLGFFVFFFLLGFGVDSSTVGSLVEGAKEKVGDSVPGRSFTLGVRVDGASDAEGIWVGEFEEVGTDD